jgi:hypothetical protein
MNPWHTTQQFFEFKRLAEHATKVRGELKDRLMDFIEEAVHLEDDEAWEDEKGNQFYRLPEGVEDPTKKGRVVQVLKREKRVANVLDEPMATLLLKNKGLLERCTQTIEVLDEEAIIGLNFSGELTDKELQSIYDQKVTWAFVQQEGD